MKKLLFYAGVFILMCSSISVSANTIANTKNVFAGSFKADVPPAIVVTNFQSIFGNVPVFQWKARNNGQWRAHFLRNGVRWEATFTSAGMLVKSERD